MKIFACIFVVTALAASSAAAQGRGKTTGKARSGPVTSGSASSASALSGSGARQFGSWLDDASMLAPGNAWTAISFGHYRTGFSHQTDFPVVDANIGLARRAQIGITVPYYRLHFTDGRGLQGLGDVYFNAKFSLVKPSDRGARAGVAVTPIVELLDEPDGNQSRFAWAAPVSLEFRGAKYRLFGSTGYFSRGAIFATSAVEVPITDRLTVTGGLSLMRSVNVDKVADALGIAKTRSDLTAVAAYFLTPSIAAFGGTGRTIAGLDPSGTSLMLTAGLSVTFAPRVTP